MRHQRRAASSAPTRATPRRCCKSLAVALFMSERIKTTEARAKEVRPLVDKVITWAKKGDVHSRRLAIAALGTRNSSPRSSTTRERYEGRPGGYTRIMKLGPRKGDSAPMVIMELVD